MPAASKRLASFRSFSENRKLAHSLQQAEGYREAATRTALALQVYAAQMERQKRLPDEFWMNFIPITVMCTIFAGLTCLGMICGRKSRGEPNLYVQNTIGEPSVMSLSPTLSQGRPSSALSSPDGPATTEYGALVTEGRSRSHRINSRQEASAPGGTSTGGANIHSPDSPGGGPGHTVLLRNDRETSTNNTGKRTFLGKNGEQGQKLALDEASKN